MFQTKFVGEITKHVLCLVTFFFLENRAIYEIMWKNIVERGRPQMTIWHKCVACWIITKAKHTLTLRNTALSLQQRLHERASLLRLYVQGGLNMTGTDLYVNKPHCAAAVRP